MVVKIRINVKEVKFRKKKKRKKEKSIFKNLKIVKNYDRFDFINALE